MIDLDTTKTLAGAAIEDWMELDRVWWAADEGAHESQAKTKRDTIRVCLFAVRSQRFTPAMPYIEETL
jgi:hypothetical protein